MVKKILTIGIGMTGGYPIDGKPKEKGHDITPGKHRYGLYIGIMALVMIVIVAAVFYTGTSAQTSEGYQPPSDPKQPVPGPTDTPSPTQKGQETINTAGISVSLAGYDFYKAKQWSLNTLYVDPKNPGNGILLVRMKDIEYLQPFRIGNAEYSNFRFEKHEKDISGFIARLRADEVALTPERNRGTATLWIQVWDRLPQKTPDGAIANGAVTLFTSDMDFEQLPPSNSVLLIKIQ